MKPAPRTETDLASHTTFAQNTSPHTEPNLPVFRPKRRTEVQTIVLDSPMPKRAWPRIRIALSLALLAHVALLSFFALRDPQQKQTPEVLTQIQFEDETAASNTDETSHMPREIFSAPPILRRAEAMEHEDKNHSAQPAHEIEAQQTSPEAGGTSLSENTKLDLPGMIGALNAERPRARGVGSRSSAGANAEQGQIAMQRNFEAMDETLAALGDLTSNALVATNSFRNRSSNGLGKKESGTGIDLGKGSGGGVNAEGPGGLLGDIGGGATLGGGGYGRRFGRGAGNGHGSGLGNGTELGIALARTSAEQEVNLHDLIAWMKAHPSTLPKLLQYDMEHHRGDLAAAVSFQAQGKKYELFLSCNEADMLLRICLIQGEQFTMLKDHGIKEASNYLATGEVVRAGTNIQSLITSRQAPGQAAQQFYRIFWQWWEGRSSDQ